MVNITPIHKHLILLITSIPGFLFLLPLFFLFVVFMHLVYSRWHQPLLDQGHKATEEHCSYDHQSQRCSDDHVTLL